MEQLCLADIAIRQIGDESGEFGAVLVVERCLNLSPRYVRAIEDTVRKA